MTSRGTTHRKAAHVNAAPLYRRTLNRSSGILLSVSWVVVHRVLNAAATASTPIIIDWESPVH